MKKTASETLAANLKLQMESNPDDFGSQPKLAKKAKIGQRTVGRALKGAVSTQLGSIEALASAFDMEAWELLVPPNAPGAPDAMLLQLIDLYGQLSDDRKHELVEFANFKFAQDWPHPSPSNPYPHASPRPSVHQPVAPYGKKEKTK